MGFLILIFYHGDRLIKIGKLNIALTNGRSGSSLIVGILAKHGMWTGPVKSGDPRNPMGFFENSEIYRLSGKHGAKTYLSTGKPDKDWESAFCDLITKQGYKNGSIVIKHTPHNWRMWESWNPIFFTIRRSVTAQMSSRQSSGHGVKGYSHVQWGEKFMDKAENELGAIRVDSADIIEGDYSKIEQILSLNSMKLNTEICEKFIKPDYWHFGG